MAPVAPLALLLAGASGPTGLASSGSTFWLRSRSRGGANMTNITSRFSLDQVDHHELLDILTLRYQTCWRVSDREITFPAAHDYRLKLEMRHGQIIKITSGDSLSSAELQNLLEQVDADLKDDRIAEYGVDILFAHHPVQGGFRFGSLPMQILPAPPEAPRPPQLL